MSGFAAVLHLDGAPVDRVWLETMADFLAFRGPDARQIWASGSIGLCHTLLGTSLPNSPASAIETRVRAQIASLDGRFWITGDVRIDDQETLISKLPSGRKDLRNATSAELILEAYAAWGESCVEHLLGDFSFVIWDAPKRSIFAARDQMGVRPFYYALIGQCLLISNTVDCIRQIGIVPSDLNDRAIGDFLLVGQNKYPAETFFSAVSRLPVAHHLTADSNGVRTKRYWTLPVEEPIYYKRGQDYVERFQELLAAAVGDRLPDGPLGVLMSGGLDSPLLAATAVRLGKATTAFTDVYDRLIPDEERHYAGLVAQHLGIPIRYRVMDDEPWGWDSGSPPFHPPEPSSNPLTIVPNQKYRREISGHSRVFFTGIGPDAALLYEWRPHLNYLIRQRRWNRLVFDFVSDFVACPRVHFLHRLRRIWMELSVPDWYTTSFPSIFATEFSNTLHLRERFEQHHVFPIGAHPVRPEGYGSFACDFPMGGADDYDAATLATSTEFRHPFLDLRLLRFLLSVPVMPWCRDKHLIRTSLRGLVPETVRLRPKAPVAGFPYLEQIRDSNWPTLPAHPLLKRYLKSNQAFTVSGLDREAIDNQLRILGLQQWLLGV